jgi:hypothetical protein
VEAGGRQCAREQSGDFRLVLDDKDAVFRQPPVATARCCDIPLPPPLYDFLPVNLEQTLTLHRPKLQVAIARRRLLLSPRQWRCELVLPASDHHILRPP